MVSVVTSSKVPELTADLSEVAGDWRLFAGQLGVEEGKLRQIEVDNANKPNFSLLCLLAALYSWVESSDSTAYEDVIKVFMPGNILTNVPLAKKIIGKYQLQTSNGNIENEAEEGHCTANAKTTSAESDLLKISFFVSFVTLLACILATVCVGRLSFLPDCPSSSQPYTPNTSLPSLVQLITELESIKLGHQDSNNVEYNLPYLPERFIGRKKELLELTHLLIDHSRSGVNAVVIYGPPAVGKSSLAIHVGYEIAKQGVNVRYINIQESSFFRHADKSTAHPVSNTGSVKHTSSHQIAERVADMTLGLSDAQATDLLKWSTSLKHHTLLVLDNYDISVDKQFLWDLRRASRFLRIIITCQQKLLLIDYKPFHLKSLDTKSAIELLRHGLSHQTLSDIDCRIICEAVDRNPLAVKITAHLVNGDTLIKDFIGSLQRKPIKVLNEDIGLPKNSTLLAVLSLAYDRLNKNTKQCGHFISTFPGSFDSEVGGRVLQMCLNDTYSSDQCLKELAERSLLESYLLPNQRRYRFQKLIRAFFPYIVDANIDDESEVITADSKIFNHSFVHCYVDKMSRVLLKCSDHCTDEEGAFLEFDNHNIWKAIHTISYMCEANTGVSLSFVMNWTEVYALLSRSPLQFRMTFAKRAEVVRTTLKCLDHLVDISRDFIESDKILETYATLVSLAKFRGAEECVELCKAAYESQSRHALLDSLYSTSSTATHLQYIQLKHSTFPSFCMMHCRSLEVFNYAGVIQESTFVFNGLIIFFIYFLVHGPKLIAILIILCVCTKFYYVVFSSPLSLISAIDDICICYVLWRALSSLDLAYHSAILLAVTMFLLYIVFGGNVVTSKNYMARDIIQHEYGNLVWILTILLAFLIRYLLFHVVKCFVKVGLSRMIKIPLLLTILSYALMFCVITFISSLSSTLTFYFVTKQMA